MVSADHDTSDGHVRVDSFPLYLSFVFSGALKMVPTPGLGFRALVILNWAWWRRV